MGTIFTPTELSEMNATLLHGGAPLTKIKTGYNAFDHISGKRLQDVTDVRKMSKLSRLLLKYCNTHLGVNTEDMMATIKYYDRYKADVYISVASIDDKGIWCRWPFSPKIRGIVTKLGKTNYKYEKDSLGWRCRLSFKVVETVAQKLQDLGFNVDEIFDAIDDTDTDTQEPQEQEMAVTAECGNILPEYVDGVVDMTIGRANADILTIQLDMNNPASYTVMNTIKTLIYSHFNNKARYWEIDILESHKLYERLQEQGIVAEKLKFWSDLTTFNSNYTYTGATDPKRNPYPFQIDDVNTLLKGKAMLLGNDMGCGKTYEAIMAGESLPFSKLVICPASLRLNWKKEILMVNPDADIVVLQSSDKFHTGKDWTIIGYSSLSTFALQLEHQFFQGVFIDEAHFIKAIKTSGMPDSQRASVVLRIAKTAEYVYPITGTPKPNRNKDLYNLLKIIRHPVTTGKYAWNNYGKTFCSGEKTSWGWNFDGSSNNEMLHNLLQPFMVRHLKSEVLPHLKKVRSFIPVKVDLREYNMEIDEYLKNRENKEAEQLARLLRARLALARRKAGEAVEFSKNFTNQGEQVVIVTNFTEVVHTISEHYKDNCVKIVGGMSDIQKDNAVTTFQEGKAQVCVMNTLAGGVGLTLTAACNTIFVDFDWTPGNMIQAEDRTCRTGQNRLCNMYYLYAEGAEIDETFAETLTDKMESINTTIDGGEGESVDMRHLIEIMLERKAVNAGFKPIIKKQAKIHANRAKEDKADNKIVEQPKHVINKVKTAVKNSVTTKNKQVNYKTLTLKELQDLAVKSGVSWKHNANEAIERMRITMALKKYFK